MIFNNKKEKFFFLLLLHNIFFLFIKSTEIEDVFMTIQIINTKSEFVNIYDIDGAFGIKN